jgi:NitT/TauT family transport system permease protein
VAQNGLPPSRSALRLEIPCVFARVTVILIGLLVESVIFRALENARAKRWGMQR